MKAHRFIIFFYLGAIHFAFTCLSKEFNFMDPKGVNSIIFQMDAPLESINGSANGISGTVSYNPSKPEATNGFIKLKASTLHSGNPVLVEHMHGEDWLDVAKFPDITFWLKQLKGIKNEGIHIVAEAEGKLCIKNVTLKMTVPVQITYLENMLEKRNRVPGDLLVIRCKFTVKRDDFNLQPGEKLEKVSNDIDISLNLAGFCLKK